MNYRTLRGKFHLTAETANYGWPPGRGSAGGGGKWLEICLGYLWQSCHFPGNFWGDVFFVCIRRNIYAPWIIGVISMASPQEILGCQLIMAQKKKSA